MNQEEPLLTEEEYAEACEGINKDARDLVMLATLFCKSQPLPKLQIIHGLAIVMLEHQNKEGFEEAFRQETGTPVTKEEIVAGHKMTLAVAEAVIEFKRRMDLALGAWVEVVSDADPR